MIKIFFFWFFFVPPKDKPKDPLFSVSSFSRQGEKKRVLPKKTTQQAGKSKKKGSLLFKEKLKLERGFSGLKGPNLFKIFMLF